jgi:phosphoadenosine phosphosulfate reductase
LPGEQTTGLTTHLRPGSTDRHIPLWGDRTHPQAVIAWALARYGRSELTMTSGFNLNGIVLIDMAVDAGYSGEVVFVDTGYHFSETLATRDKVEARYPELQFVTLQANRPDDRMFATDPDQCCRLRKVTPVMDYMDEKRPAALLSGRSRDQSNTRASLEFVETGPERDLVNPLVHWDRAALEAYANTRELPLNPLYDEGFLSIGCAPCTRAVKAGEHPRMGRWPGMQKTECGLWKNEA